MYSKAEAQHGVLGHALSAAVCTIRTAAIITRSSARALREVSQESPERIPRENEGLLLR
jgi:hypothetical protein